MKKLEDIPKKNVFEVPEGYFDRLPGVIQSRIAEEKKQTRWSVYLGFSLKYALPVLVIGAGIVFYLSRPAALSAEELLATVDTQQLVAYLDETEVNSDELLEGAPLSDDEASALQDDSMNELEMNGNDVQQLTDEFGVDYF
ncbi:MAG: hypothetical protein K2U26_03380 [Cyclobacteriaceae bacterium]|nr:hypothetical protein [Cyclobacteriaceae bacterium]